MKNVTDIHDNRIIHKLVALSVIVLGAVIFFVFVSIGKRDVTIYEAGDTSMISRTIAVMAGAIIPHRSG
jgi:uncharacterized membrane protein YhfC